MASARGSRDWIKDLDNWDFYNDVLDQDDIINIWEKDVKSFS